MSDWTDTKVILHELEQLFNRDDDVKDILDIKKMADEIEIQMANKIKDSKEIIRIMTAQVASKESEINAPSQADHLAALKKVSNKESLSQQNEVLAKLIDAKRQNTMKMTNTGLSLKERANEFIVSSDMADSKTAYAISLYAKISNITWDYNAPQGKLAGCVGNDQTKELHNFSLDTRALTSFEIANNLWQLIDASPA